MFALLDVRRVIHLVVLAGCLSAIHAWGPPELQVPVNRFIVAPVTQSMKRLQQPLNRGAAALRDLGWR